MAFDSYREFLQQLDRAGELIRISEPVATELEITALADRQMKSPGGGNLIQPGPRRPTTLAGRNTAAGLNPALPG